MGTLTSIPLQRELLETEISSTSHPPQLTPTSIPASHPTLESAEWLCPYSSRWGLRLMPPAIRAGISWSPRKTAYPYDLTF